MEIHLPKLKEIIMIIISEGRRERNQFVRALMRNAVRSKYSHILK